MTRLGRMPRAWEGRLRNLQGECHHVAGDQALKEKKYEEALSTSSPRPTSSI